MAARSKPAQSVLRPYVIERVRNAVRYTAMYTDENGRYKSAGTYDSEERA